MTNDRPDPDALLADVNGAARGRFKLFIGAAPGVGKTFEMLAQARRRFADGVDVVGGVIETHGRAETEAQVGDLPRLAPLMVPYRDRTIEEFDLDAALARRPALLLVDELAHTNAPGLRHAKRWEDVDELLAAGIPVWATLNIQHLESLNDDVTRITGVRVAETLPDRVLEMADDIELVDLPPAELRSRLREGRIYRDETATRALEGFFRESNLTALREIALRQAASRVDRDVRDWMRRSLTAGPYPATARILALVGTGEQGATVVRYAKRLADALHAPWIALHVERAVGPRDAPLPARGALALARHLGGEAETVAADGSLLETVLAAARARNATEIVVGPSTRPRFRIRQPFRAGRLAPLLAARAPEFGVHVAPLPDPTRTASARRPRVRSRPGTSALSAASLLAVAAVTATGLAFRPVLPVEAADMIYLVPVIGAAMLGGTGPALVAAFSAVLAWDFFFVPPFYQVTIDRPRDVITGVVFAAVAILTGGLAGRVRAEARTAAARIEGLRRIGAFSRRFTQASAEPELLRAVAAEAAALCGGAASVLMPAEATADLGVLPVARAGSAAEIVVAAVSPEDTRLDEGALAAARRAFTQGEQTGSGTATLPGARFRFLPFGTATERRGVLGVAAAGTLDGPTLQALEALVDQAAAALERVRLMAGAARSRALEETEQLRTALLVSLGHDLRTPLAGIQGAAGTLRTSWHDLAPATRDDLLASLEEDVARMARFLANISELTRIEGGQLKPRLIPIAVGPVIDAAIALLPGAPLISTGVGAGAGLVARADPALLEQALFNLLDNAARYSPENAPVAVGVRREGDTVAITVADSGIGIPAADLPHVFESWYRARQADRVAPGTGLGLAIARGLISAQGGTIEARSPNPDAPRDGLPGTVMIVRLLAGVEAAGTPGVGRAPSDAGRAEILP